MKVLIVFTALICSLLAAVLQLRAQGHHELAAEKAKNSEVQSEKSDSKGEILTYHVKMSGLKCSGCRGHVTDSFVLLDGVMDVKVKPHKEEGFQDITITTTHALTRDQLVKALGKEGEQYLVHELTQI